MTNRSTRAKLSQAIQGTRLTETALRSMGNDLADTLALRSELDTAEATIVSNTALVASTEARLIASPAQQTVPVSTVFDDFHGIWNANVAATEQIRLWLSTKGSGGNTAVATTVANSVNGEVTLTSSTADGATSANASNITGSNLGYKANKGGLAMEARLKIDDIVEAYVFVGFTDVLGSTVEHPIDFTDASNTLISDATNACGIVFSGDATTQQWCHGGVKANSDTTAAFSGSAPVNDTYVVLRVEVSAAGAVQGFINGTAIGAAVANAVTITTALTPAVVVSSTAAAATVMTLDYIWVQQNR